MTTAAVAKHTFKKDSKVAYLVADYAYGHEMLRGFKRAQQAIGATSVGEILHPFGAADYSTFMPRLRSMRPDILCICNFGRDQANSVKQAVDFGMNRQSKIVVPVLLHNQRLAIGPEAFEGVIGGANYYWGLEDTIPTAKSFNDAFKAANGGAYPTDYGAYGFSGVYSLLLAMEKAGGTDTDKVIAALEVLKYDIAKGPQHYRKCDHQSVQSVLVLESKKKAEMKNEADLFKVLATEPASETIPVSYTHLDVYKRQAQLTVAHHHAPQGYPFAFTNGVQGCHVELDVETGFVNILKHWVVEDCGRIINTLLVGEPVRGGVVQGPGFYTQQVVYKKQRLGRLRLVAHED